jgi:hypothetical protein
MKLVEAEEGTISTDLADRRNGMGEEVRAEG